MRKRISIYVLAAICSLGSFVAEAVGTATVVRAHPRLTRGLEKESLIGIRFDDNFGGAPSTITVALEFNHCTSEDLSELAMWRQPFDPLPYAFYEAKAKKIADAVTVEKSAALLRVSFTATEHIYPHVGTRADSDYLWITAKVNPNISTAAEIKVSIENDRIVLGTSEYIVKNGTAQSPHRAFPHYYQIGAYFRSDRVSATSCAPLGDATSERVKNLTDLILINNMYLGHRTDGSLYATWPAGESEKVAYIKSLRDTYHPDAMVRLGFTKGASMNDIADDAKRAQLVESIVSIMKTTGVDGLDVDWEYPESASEWISYGKLLRDLSPIFFEEGWVLSICTNLGYLMPNEAQYGVFHVPDYIDSMAYGGKPMNASPGVMKTGIAVCTNRGVPNRRIVVGQAMYAYENGNPGWSGVVNWIKKQYGDDKIRWWDADYVLRDGTTKETYEGPSSYHAKCNWCRANDYGGVMSWGYYTDVAWNGDDLMSLARHQAKSCWPITSKTWPTPEQDQEGWYLLKTESDWFWLRDNSKVKAKFAADITLEHDPLPIESWQGTLDGNGHKLIIPRDTWLCYDDNPALIRTLNGTVKNLTIDLYGRVVSRASRWNDTACTTGENTLTTPLNDHCAAVLAARARWGASVDNVTVVVHAGAEVQGPVRTSALIADVFVSLGNKALITNSKAIIEGTVHSLARNTAESDIAVTEKLVGSLIASASVGTGSTVTIDNCAAYSESGMANIGEKANAIVATITSGVDVRDAYLFNCDLDKLAEKNAAFKFTSEDLAALMRGETLTTINGVEFNGKLTILGASALDGEWSENLEGAKFFKAVLTLE
ncbi:MAG: glycoside hydrolase family 18 protein [Kiritimatiellae bacterium]|nr:glycoside hydrolase family 18 protein [Kiritimatiellia bacterium]